MNGASAQGISELLFFPQPAWALGLQWLLLCHQNNITREGQQRHWNVNYCFVHNESSSKWKLAVKQRHFDLHHPSNIKQQSHDTLSHYHMYMSQYSLVRQDMSLAQFPQGPFTEQQLHHTHRSSFVYLEAVFRIILPCMEVSEYFLHSINNK